MRLLAKSFPAVGAGISLAVMLAMPAEPLRAGDNGSGTVPGNVPAEPRETLVQAPAALQGMRVYRDPQTGHFGPPPPGVQPPGLSSTELRMLSRSDRGLQPRTLPGGAVAVDLQGRYRSMAVATVGTDGQAAVNCAATPAQAAAALQPAPQAEAGSAE